MATKKTASAKSSSSSTKKNNGSKKKRAASPARRKSRSASTTAKGKSVASEKEVTIDRRRADRRTDAVEAEQTPAQPPMERRKKVQRRRQIDPTTCERDYTDAEVEFMNSMDEYKRKSGRMFPTCSEVLEVIRDLGYVQLSPAGRAMLEQSDLAVTDLIEPADADDDSPHDPLDESLLASGEESSDFVGGSADVLEESEAERAVFAH